MTDESVCPNNINTIMSGNTLQSASLTGMKHLLQLKRSLIQDEGNSEW